MYLIFDDDRVGFEPAMCMDVADAMSQARHLLASRQECEAVDVFLGDERLVRIGRPSQ